MPAVSTPARQWSLRAEGAAPLALAALLAAFVLVGAPRVHSGGPDIGALMLTTPDEHLIASGLWGMFEERTLDYRIPPYGGVYPNLAYLTLKPVLRAVGQTERHLVLGLRWFSLVLGALALVGAYVLSRVLGAPPWAALLGAGIVAASPELLYWSVRVHPDTLLAVELEAGLACLALAARRRSQRWLNAAFVLSVLATMTKVVGVFMLPWIALVQLTLLEPGEGRARARALLRRGAWAGALALALAYLTTPTLLVNSRAFIHGVLEQARQNHSGVASTASPVLGWGGELLGPDLVGPTACLFFVGWCVSLAHVVLRAARRRSLHDEALLARLPELVVAGFAVGFVGYLFVSTRLYEARYALPALPAFGAAVAVGSGVSLRQGAAARRVAVIIAALLGLVAEAPGRWGAMRGDAVWLGSRARDPGLEVGAWLEANVPPSARLIYDYGVYVPLRYRRAFKTFALLRSQLERHRPTHLLMHDARRAMYRDEADAKGDARDRAFFVEAVQTLRALEAGELAGYRQVARFAEAGVTIYADTSQRACPAECP